MICKGVVILAWLFIASDAIYGFKRFREIVTNEACNEKTCQLQPGGVIHCCFLKPLNDLNQILDAKSIRIPSSLRLHIMLVDKERALCTEFDTFRPTPGITKKRNAEVIKMCSGAFKLKFINNGLFQRLSGLTIRQTELEYISERVFSFFPMLKHLVIQENPNLAEIPAVNGRQKNMLQTIHYTGNPKIRSVTWNEKIALPSLREFVFSNFKAKATENPNINFEMGTFTPGKNFNNLVMRLNYEEVTIKMPSIKKTQRVQTVFIGTSNVPENLNVDFSAMHGKIEQLVYNLPVKPEKIFQNLLPYDVYEKFGNVGIHFDNENYELKSLRFYNTIPKSRVIRIRTQGDRDQLIDLSKRFGRPKQVKTSGDKIYLQYVVLTTDELARVAKDTQKQYKVKTHFLWVRDVNYLQKAIKIHLRYNFLIISKKSALFSADVPSPINGRDTVNKDYRDTFSTSQLWDNFDLKQIYEFLITAATISKRSGDISERKNNKRVRGIEHQLVTTMLNSVNEFKVLQIARDMSPPVTKMQYHFVEDALYKTHKLIAFERNSVAKSKSVIDFTEKTYQEKTVLLQDIIKTLITSERYEKNSKMLLNGNKLLFDTTQTRIKLLQNVEKQNMEKKIQKEKLFRRTLVKITGLRHQYENNLRIVKKRFYDIIKGKNKVGKFEHLVYVLDAIMNVFNDKFHSSEILFPEKGKIKNPNIYKTDMIKALRFSLSTIYTVLTRIKELRASVVQKFIRTTPRRYDVLEHKDPEKHMFTYFDMRKKQIASKEGFSCDDAITVTNKLYDVNIEEILRWDIVMKLLDKLLDTSISKEIPETLAFKTTLLRLMDISKVETQAMYDIAKVEADLFLGNYSDDVFNLQLSQISKVMKKYLEDVQDDDWVKARADIEDEFMTTRALSISQLKLDVFLHIQDYCSWIEYNTLQECILAQQFTFDASLSSLLYLTNELLVATVMPVTQEVTSQTFVDLPIHYKFDGQCQEITKVVNNAYNDLIKSSKKKLKNKKKDNKKKQAKKIPAKTNTTTSAATTPLFNPITPDNPPLLTWPVPFNGNYPVVFDPFNMTEVNGLAPAATYKKTRVEPNITIIDAPNVILQGDGDDDFMQVAKLANRNDAVSGKKRTQPRKSHAQKRAKSRVTSATKSTTNATTDTAPAGRTTNDITHDTNTTVYNETHIDNFTGNISTEQQSATPPDISTTSLTNLTSNTTTNPISADKNSQVRETTVATAATIADAAESSNSEKEIKSQVLADWIGERILENEIRKHKSAIQQRSERRSSTMHNSHQGTYPSNSKLTINRNVTAEVRSRSMISSNYTDKLMSTNTLRLRRSSDDYSFITNLFNNDLSLYMVTNGIETREEFETMFRKCNASKVVELRENNVASVSLSLYNKQFRAFDKVRIEEVKVFLHGAQTSSGFLEVQIESESILQDRLGNRKYIFTGEKWNRLFRYKIPRKTETLRSAYEIKADIHTSRTPLTLVPTPFTTWLISVPIEQNPGLDLSGLTSIEILFSGSFIVNSKIDLGSNIPDFFQNIKKEKEEYLKEKNKKQTSIKNKKKVDTRKVATKS